MGASLVIGSDENPSVVLTGEAPLHDHSAVERAAVCVSAGGPIALLVRSVSQPRSRCHTEAFGQISAPETLSQRIQLATEFADLRSQDLEFRSKVLTIVG